MELAQCATRENLNLRLRCVAGFAAFFVSRVELSAVSACARKSVATVVSQFRSKRKLQQKSTRTYFIQFLLV